jgi:hypothetical protein
MPTTDMLSVRSDDREIQLYLNDQDEIFIEEQSDDPVNSFWFALNREDWEIIKKFIDTQFGL